MNVEDDPCNHERKWEKELGKDAKKKQVREEKRNDTSDNYFAVHCTMLTYKSLQW